MGNSENKITEKCIHKGKWELAGYTALISPTENSTFLHITLFCKECGETGIKSARVDLPRNEIISPNLGIKLKKN